MNDANIRNKPLYYPIEDQVILDVSFFKKMIRFGKQGKLNPHHKGPFEIFARSGHVAYQLKLPRELKNMYDTFHVSNLKKCMSNTALVIPLDAIN